MLWIFLVNQLRVEWTVNEQYNYGWFVPLLSLYLGWEAWALRPEPGRPMRGIWLGVVLAGMLFLLLPLRLVLEANPDWRPVSWTLAILTVGITWCGLYARGGYAWWRHFAFASAFILTAVPWPTVLERSVVQAMMQGVAAISVELLTWLGIPARAMGNVIALPGQLVGVDEACSGVRSLQTVIMASLFLGELYRLTGVRRVALLGLAVALAFVANVLRAFVLVWVVANSGAESLSRWHDPLGYAVLVASLGGVWALGHALRGQAIISPSLPQTDAAWFFTPAMGSIRAGVLIFVWLLFVEIATEGWYYGHEVGAVRATPWTVSLPRQGNQYKAVTLSEQESRLLRVNQVEAGSWLEPDGTELVVYFLRWSPGRNAAQLARLHRPEVCLPSAGCFLRSDEGSWTGDVRGLSLPFRQLIFDYNGAPLYVFYCLTEDRVIRGSAEGEDWTAASRLRAVAEGRRHLGQQVLEVILRGPQSPQQAEATMRRLLPQIVKPEGGS